jgi:hypothetical protein
MCYHIHCQPTARVINLELKTANLLERLKMGLIQLVLICDTHHIVLVLSRKKVKILKIKICEKLMQNGQNEQATKF